MTRCGARRIPAPKRLVGIDQPGRWYLIAMPCGLAGPEPSGTFGIPVESEKRAVTGIVLPSDRAALLNTAASGDGLNLPSTTTPLA